MGFDNKYPYTDFHEINLDWLLGKVKGIDDRFVAIEEAVAALREDLDIQTGRIDAALDAVTFIQNHYPAMIASQYDEERQYDPGEIAIYDNESKEFVTCQSFNTTQTITSKSFDIDCELESGKTYLVKAMMFNNGQKPLVMSKEITLTK